MHAVFVAGAVMLSAVLTDTRRDSHNQLWKWGWRRGPFWLDDRWAASNRDSTQCGAGLGEQQQIELIDRSRKQYEKRR